MHQQSYSTPGNTVVPVGHPRHPLSFDLGDDFGVDINSGSSSGPLAAATLASLSIDTAFLSVGAWDLDHGLTTSETDKLTLKRAARQAAQRTFLVADSTKFDTHARFKAVALDELDLIITDDRLSEPDRKRLEDSGVRIDCARL